MNLKSFFYKKVNSTNDLAIKKIKQGYLNGIIISEEQLKGRGRRGKKWISLKGNLFITIFFEISEKKSLQIITNFNLNIIKKILSDLLKTKISVKPPNDLLINKKKICGILQETIFFNTNKFLIVGVGINLIKYPIIKNYPTTSLLNEKGHKISKLKIINMIKKKYEMKLKKLKINNLIDKNIKCI